MNNVGTARKWATLVIGCLAALVLNIDMTVLHLAIPDLIKALRPSGTQVLWIADIYGFTLAGLLIPMGVLGDRIGRKKLLLAGVALFGAVSALTAYSSSASMLIVWRALLGVAGATVMPSTLSLIRNVFTDAKERTTAVGIFSGIGALGIGIGPILGGALLDHFWWGSVFLVNLPIMAVIFLVGLVVLPESRNPRPGRIDLVSVPLSVAGVLGLVYAVTEAGHSGLGEARVGLAAVSGAACLAVFAWRQTRTDHPLIDLSLFRNAAFTGSVATNLIAMFALVAQSLVFSQYFQLVWHWSPMQAGLAGLPGALFAMMGGAGLAPVLIPRLGRSRTVAIGLTLSAAGFLIYTRGGVTPGYWILLAGMFPGAMGVGMALTVTSDTILASVPRARAGAASAISETATELGGALWMAVLGSVLTAVYRGNLTAPAGLAPSAAHSVRDSLGNALVTAQSLPAGLAVQVENAAKHAFVDGMHAALCCSAGLALLTGLIALVTLRRVPKVIPEHVEQSDEDSLSLVG
jgi:DHA2 family multidrug resistance protein-like MFS transporter